MEQKWIILNVVTNILESVHFNILPNLYMESYAYPTLHKIFCYPHRYRSWNYRSTLAQNKSSIRERSEVDSICAIVTLITVCYLSAWNLRSSENSYDVRKKDFSFSWVLVVGLDILRFINWRMHTHIFIANVSWQL